MSGLTYDTERLIGDKYLAQKHYFATGITRDAGFRRRQLVKLRDAVHGYEADIAEALRVDLHKSHEESYLTETGLVLSELRHHIRGVGKWTKPRRVGSPLYMFPSRGSTLYEPLGNALIISPWNYPFQLLMMPLVGAISAGCCAMLKPSPDAPATAALVERIVSEIFAPEYVAVVQGGKDENTMLLSHRFDMIFFTGSTRVGRVVMEAAAKHLTPVVLELGGKSPCIVDRDADLKRAAARIAWGKTLNAGQTCIAPDYLMVHRSVKQRLVGGLAENFRQMYGADIAASPYYPRMITYEAAQRVAGLISEGRVLVGGGVDVERKYIEPTVIEGVSPDDDVMQQEIFGPVLPLIEFDDISEVTDFIKSREKPLALYYFGGRAGARRVLESTSSGGACINDVVMHVASPKLPFGGVGASGTGRYHGFDSFKAFSNRRSVLRTPTIVDLPVKYPPFKWFGLVKKLMK